MKVYYTILRNRSYDWTTIFTYTYTHINIVFNIYTIVQYNYWSCIHFREQYSYIHIVYRHHIRSNNL